MSIEGDGARRIGRGRQKQKVAVRKPMMRVPMIESALAAERRSPTPINDRAPISPQIYEWLRRAITTLAMLPSESLSEQDLAKQLGVSRTPVREAIIRLADEGLIDVLPQRGSFVAPIRLREVEEAQFIREALEVAVARRLAAGPSEEFLDEVRANLRLQEFAVRNDDQERFLELDEAFHRSLCDAAGLPKSWRVIQKVNSGRRIKK